MSIDYNIYLDEHRANVVKSYWWLKENIPEIFRVSSLLVDNLDEVFSLVSSHDQSKDSVEEYPAYDDYFYNKRSSRSHSVMLQFHYAWVHQQHNNPHHWQHWVMIPDSVDEEPIGLPIPHKYIIEMVCDWMSFGFKTNGNRYGENLEKPNIRHVIDYYEEVKDHLIMDWASQNYLVSIMEKIERKLDEIDAEQTS